MPAKEGKLRLRPLAEADLEEIWLYSFKRWSMEQADKYVGDLVMTVNDLTRGTKAGRECKVRDGYFQYAVASHLVFYRVTSAAPDVTRILHQRMDVERHPLRDWCCAAIHAKRTPLGVLSFEPGND